MHAFVVRKQKAQSQNQRKANMRKRVVYFALKMELFLLHPAALLDAAAQHRLMPCENTLLAVCVARRCCRKLRSLSRSDLYRG